jgi:hypothetical protein
MSDEAIAVKGPEKLTCGLIMPISQLDNLPPAHWDEIKEIITKAVEEIPDPRFAARLVSEGDDAGVIHKRIIQNVYTDDIAICDVSGRNANVMFELGMRLAFDKPTVIIKDDQTPRIFDTDVIEYVNYRRDLRHGPMENFKAKLSQKVLATYQLSKVDPDKQSFLKSFGTFKVVKLDEASESPDKAMLTLLTQMDRQLNRLASATPRRVAPPPPPQYRDEEDDIDTVLRHPDLAEAVIFVQKWAKEHTDFSDRGAIANTDFVSNVYALFPELARNPRRLRALVDIAMTSKK